MLRLCTPWWPPRLQPSSLPCQVTQRHFVVHTKYLNKGFQKLRSKPVNFVADLEANNLDWSSWTLNTYLHSTYLHTRQIGIFHIDWSDKGTFFIDVYCMHPTTIPWTNFSFDEWRIAIFKVAEKCRECSQQQDMYDVRTFPNAYWSSAPIDAVIRLHLESR